MLGRTMRTHRNDQTQAALLLFQKYLINPVPTKSFGGQSLVFDNGTGWNSIMGRERRIAAATHDSNLVCRLLKMPGIGPICAMTVETFAPATQHDIQCLLIVGAMTVVEWKERSGGRPGSGLARMLAAIGVHLLAVFMKP